MMLLKHMEKMFEGKLHKDLAYSLEPFLQTHPTEQQLLGHLPPIL